MTLDYVHIADYASVSREGKLSIAGIFQTIFCEKLPALHPQFFICLQLSVTDGDIGTRQSMYVRISDPEGKEIFGADGQINIQEDAMLQPLSLQFRVNGISFHAYGPHEVEVTIGNHTVRKLTLNIARLPHG